MGWASSTEPGHLQRNERPLLWLIWKARLPGKKNGCGEHRGARDIKTGAPGGRILLHTRQQAYCHICEALKRGKKIYSYFSTSRKEINDCHWMSCWHKNLKKPDIRTYIKMILYPDIVMLIENKSAKEKNIQLPRLIL